MKEFPCDLHALSRSIRERNTFLETVPAELPEGTLRRQISEPSLTSSSSEQEGSRNGALLLSHGTLVRRSLRAPPPGSSGADGASSSRGPAPGLNHVLWGRLELHGSSHASSGADDGSAGGCGHRSRSRDQDGYEMLKQRGIIPDDILFRAPQSSSDPDSHTDFRSVSSASSAARPVSPAEGHSKTAPQPTGRVLKKGHCGDDDSDGSEDVVAPAQVGHALEQSGERGAISASDLGGLLQRVPLDDNGNPTSIGSIPHFEGGKCKVCTFVHSKSGCVNGVACTFCHIRHNRVRPKPKKKAEAASRKDRYNTNLDRLLSASVA